MMSRAALILGLCGSVLLHLLILLPDGDGASSGQDAMDEQAEVEVQTMPIPPVAVAPAPQPINEDQTPPPAEPEASEPVDRPEQPKQQNPREASLPVRQARTTPAADEAERGDFAGSGEGEPEPSLRIDWGNERLASRVLVQGGMKLVVIESGSGSPSIVAELEHDGRRWVRRGYQPAVGPVFSNRLRIVDEVPAFESMRRAAKLEPLQRLAVLVPNQVEQMLASAQLAAAYRQGMEMTQVRDFGGEFELSGDRLSFRITRVLPRSETP